MKLMTCGCRSDNNPKCFRCSSVELEDHGNDPSRKVGDAQDTWMENLSDMEADESDDDTSSTSDLGDSPEDLGKDVVN